MTVLYTFSNVLTAVFLTSGDCMLTQKHLRAAVPWHPLRWRRYPRCPPWKSPTAPNFLLCRGCPALRTRGQLEEDWGLSPACTPRSIPPFPHHHQWNWTESCSSVHLSGVYHHIRRQDRQRSRQQTDLGKLRFRQTLQKGMEQQASEGH